jgi:hypothetical protein
MSSAHQIAAMVPLSSSQISLWQVAYQLSAFEDLPREIEKARQCCISTGLLRKAFHRRDVTTASIRRIDELAISNLEIMARFDDYRSHNRKSLLSLHCSESVDSCGNAQEYSTAPFESNHRGIRSGQSFRNFKFRSETYSFLQITGMSV